MRRILSHKYKQWVTVAVLIGAGLVASYVILQAFNVPASYNTYLWVFISLIVAAIFSAALLKFQSNRVLLNIDIYLATFLSFTAALALALYIAYSPCEDYFLLIRNWTSQLFIDAFVGLIGVSIIASVRHRVQRSLSIIVFLIVVSLLLLLYGAIEGLPSCHARDARRISDITQLQMFLELYKNADPNGLYPATLDALIPTYIGGVPKDLRTNKPYYYAVNAAQSPTAYHLGAVLENSYNKALCSDADFNSVALGWVNGFNGSGNTPNADCNGKPNGDGVPAVYDVTSVH